VYAILPYKPVEVAFKQLNSQMFFAYVTVL